jgi:hypothetical protein
MNLVTSICVDTVNDPDSNYPQLPKNSDKRELYWRCVATFCLTSLRFNPKHSLSVYTNDTGEIIIDGYNIKQELKAKGVEIIILPFKDFDPGAHSNYFRNAFYKLEVIDQLHKHTEPSVLMDSDIIFTGSVDEMASLLGSGHILLQDTYQRSDPNDAQPHGISMNSMQGTYSKLKTSFVSAQTYPVPPVWYGGELIGANPEDFKLIGARLRETFEAAMATYHSGGNLTFSNGRQIFDGDEFVSTYVFNTLPKSRIVDTCNRFSKRIWNGIGHNNVQPADLKLPVWHLPAAKSTGIVPLFAAIKDTEHPFWGDQLNHKQFLGRYFGIPKNNRSLLQRLQFTLKRALRLSKKKLTGN